MQNTLGPPSSPCVPLHACVLALLYAYPQALSSLPISQLRLTRTLLLKQDLLQTSLKASLGLSPTRLLLLHP